MKRAITFIDELVIGIGYNENKRTMFSIEEREKTLRELYKNEPRVKIASYNDLTVDFARRMDAQFIIRGIRCVKDFEYEETIADINIDEAEDGTDGYEAAAIEYANGLIAEGKAAELCVFDTLEAAKQCARERGMKLKIISE